MPLSPVTSLAPALVLTRPDLGIRVHPAPAPTFTSWDLSASGGVVAGGNGDLALVEGIGGSAAAGSSGSAALALALALSASGAALASGAANLLLAAALAASGGGAASGSADLALRLILAASGAGLTGGAADLALLIGLTSAGAAQANGGADIVDLAGPKTWLLSASIDATVGGQGDLQIWTFGVQLVAVLVPRATGSYALRSVITGAVNEYAISPSDAGGGLVEVPPDELARFLRAVPGSLVVDPAQAELFRIARPYIAQVAGPF